MNLYRWADIGDRVLMPGIAGKKIVGERAMVCRFRYEPNVVEPVHSHESEQFSCVLAGRVRFFSNGKSIEAGPGDVVHLSSNVPHGLKVLGEGAELVEIFSPLRPDLIAIMDEARPSNGGGAE
jgi:quercetin dioxygenase-like cupin family protein